jgi:hypothetical protein
MCHPSTSQVWLSSTMTKPTWRQRLCITPGGALTPTPLLHHRDSFFAPTHPSSLRNLSKPVISHRALHNTDYTPRNAQVLVVATLTLPSATILDRQRPRQPAPGATPRDKSPSCSSSSPAEHIVCPPSTALPPPSTNKTLLSLSIQALGRRKHNSAMPKLRQPQRSRHEAMAMVHLLLRAHHTLQPQAVQGSWLPHLQFLAGYQVPAGRTADARWCWRCTPTARLYDGW